MRKLKKTTNRPQKGAKYTKTTNSHEKALRRKEKKKTEFRGQQAADKDN